MSDVEQLLRGLADSGHSRTSAHKAAGISWHTFRLLCLEHPHIRFKERKPYPRTRRTGPS